MTWTDNNRRWRTVMLLPHSIHKRSETISIGFSAKFILCLIMSQSLLEGSVCEAWFRLALTPQRTFPPPLGTAAIPAGCAQHDLYPVLLLRRGAETL